MESRQTQRKDYIGKRFHEEGTTWEETYTENEHGKGSWKEKTLCGRNDMRSERQEKGLYGERHYMEKVLHREETVQKRDYIEKRSCREEIYTKRKHIQKNHYTGRKLHKEVINGEGITRGHDSTGT